MERLQKATILKDLERKMVFLTGPRQVGKTWLAREIGKGFKKTVYLNYDSTEDRRIIREEGWPPEMELLILDELHKMKGWKNWLKGVWDTREKGLRILVTGSARLEVFRQSGDSLAGRFLRHRLLPFSVAEIGERRDESVVARLMDRGGFPEPFLAESDEDADRWRLQYADGLIREDIFDLERVRNLRAMRTIVELLRSRVGSPVSFVSLAEDTGVAPNTVRKYIEMLESLYIVFLLNKKLSSPLNQTISSS